MKFYKRISQFFWFSLMAALLALAAHASQDHIWVEAPSMVPVGDLSLNCRQNIAEYMKAQLRVEPRIQNGMAQSSLENAQELAADNTPVVSTVRRDEKDPGSRVDLDISLDGCTKWGQLEVRYSAQSCSVTRVVSIDRDEDYNCAD